MKKILSQLKRQRQNEKRRLRNRALRSTMRTSIRQARMAIEEKSTSDGAKQALAEANVTIDKMVTKGLLHKNTAARYKSRLARNMNRHASPAREMATDVEPTPVVEEQVESEPEAAPDVE